MKSLKQTILESLETSISESSYTFISSDIIDTLTNQYKANAKFISTLNDVLGKLKKIDKNLEIRQSRSSVDQIDVAISKKMKSGKYSKIADIIDTSPFVILIDDYENYNSWSENYKNIVDTIISSFNLKSTGKYSGEFSNK